MSDHTATETPQAAPAVGARLEPGVGRPVPERDIADYEHGDEEWLGNEPSATCAHCCGTGGDQWNDGITPCAFCDGEGYAWWQ